MSEDGMNLAQRPPYVTVDFKALAKSDKDFKQLWQRTSGKLDFQDPSTTQALSKAILRVDFGLELDVPDDRLCPPIPNRWNYVAWLQGLIDSTSPTTPADMIQIARFRAWILVLEHPPYIPCCA